jgi:hypothetical protein
MKRLRTESGKKYLDALEDLKSKEFDKGALLVVDGLMLRMVAVWPQVRLLYVEKPIAEPDLDEIWGNVGFRMDEWADLARVREEDAWRLWKVIICLGLIYPDGTRPEDVDLFIALRADELLRLER